MSDILCDIELHQIDLSNRQYQIGEVHSDVSLLAESIKNTVLTYPVIVRPVQDRYVIISGFHRVKALILNGADRVRVLKMPYDLPEVNYLIRAIHAVQFKQLLNQYELICAVKRLRSFLTVEEISQKSKMLFSQEFTVLFIEQLLACGDLPETGCQLIASNHLSFKTALKLLELDSKEICLLLSIFKVIKTSKNKQLEIIQYIKEIAAREKTSIEHIFNRLKLNEILFDPGLDSNTKTNQIRFILFQSRFPTLSRARIKAKKNVLDLKLGQGIQFVFPENFEDQTMTISFCAKSYAEYQSKITSLFNTIDTQAIKEIFER